MGKLAVRGVRIQEVKLHYGPRPHLTPHPFPPLTLLWQRPTETSANALPYIVRATSSAEEATRPQASLTCSDHRTRITRTDIRRANGGKTKL